MAAFAARSCRLALALRFLIAPRLLAAGGGLRGSARILPGLFVEREQQVKGVEQEVAREIAEGPTHAGRRAAALCGGGGDDQATCSGGSGR